MAYICGIVTPVEREILKKRGWDIEPCPSELVLDKERDPTEYVMVWIDCSVFGLMSSPDWET